MLYTDYIQKYLICKVNNYHYSIVVDFLHHNC